MLRTSAFSDEGKNHWRVGQSPRKVSLSFFSHWEAQENHPCGEASSHLLVLLERRTPQHLPGSEFTSRITPQKQKTKLSHQPNLEAFTLLLLVVTDVFVQYLLHLHLNDLSLSLLISRENNPWKGWVRGVQLSGIQEEQKRAKNTD